MWKHEKTGKVATVEVYAEHVRQCRSKLEDNTTEKTGEKRLREPSPREEPLHQEEQKLPRIEEEKEDDSPSKNDLERFENESLWDQPGSGMYVCV